MDSLTQIVLGAAVAELILGKKIGNKAALWGAICGTIPDLDILMNPLISDLQELSAHRGFSHSIFFSVIFAPILGYLISIFYHKKEAKWYEWALLCFGSLVTHPLLDSFTNYGTQLFLPFSNYRVALNNIFIVDPCYTVPMMLFLLVAMFFNRKKPIRSKLNGIGMIISHAYMLFTLANKLYIGTVFEQALENQNMPYQRYMTNPMPFQNALWVCIAEDTAGFRVGYYSWFDKDQNVKFKFVAKNAFMLDKLMQSFPLKRLAWFSDGYFVFTRKDNELYVNDLRFGKIGGLINNNSEFVFQWKIIQKNNQVGIEKVSMPFKWERNVFDDLVLRVKGVKKDSL